MNLLIIFGTRPEAIKMIPIIKVCKDLNIPYKLCITGQHYIVEKILNSFNIKADYNLKIMKKNQDLNYIFYKVIKNLGIIKNKEQFDFVLVHGDTTSACAAAVWAFNNKLKVVHIEAGLRSNNINNPYPEEMNRILIDQLASICFCPTIENKNNLLREKINKDKIYVVGNTIIDMISSLKSNKNKQKKQVLITCHRRENFAIMENIFNAIKNIALSNNEYQFIFPVHPNNKIKVKAEKILSKVNNCKLIEHQEYLGFINLLLESEIIITDSGGVLEEASFLGKKVLIIRKTTERNNLLSRNIILSDVEANKITKNFNYLKNLDSKLCKQNYSLGQGNTSNKIIDILLKS